MATGASKLQDAAPIALVVAASAGAAAFLLVGWVAFIVVVTFGRSAEGGFFGSQPVVLMLIFGPLLCPLLGWWALRRQRYRVSLALSAVTATLAGLWLIQWARVI